MYLIYGESFRLIQEEINKIIKKEKNIIYLDLKEITLDDVIKEATYVSIFSEKKYIIVKNADFFGTEKVNEDDIELLLKYMENPIVFSTIIFVSYEKIDLRKKITKAFKEKYKIISVGNLAKDQLRLKMKAIMKENNFSINDDAIEYITKCCQNNFDLIYNELNKLFLYYNKPKKIEKEDILPIISRFPLENNFKFVEAVIDKKMKKASLILEDLYLFKVDPIALMMLLAREYRLMYSVNVLMEEGYMKRDILKILSLQDWQLEKIIRNNSNYNQSDLKDCLKNLAIMDFEMKSGEKDRFLLLKTFLLQVFD